MCPPSTYRCPGEPKPCSRHCLWPLVESSRLTRPGFENKTCRTRQQGDGCCISGGHRGAGRTHKVGGCPCLLTGLCSELALGTVPTCLRVVQSPAHPRISISLQLKGPLWARLHWLRAKHCPKWEQGPSVRPPALRMDRRCPWAQLGTCHASSIWPWTRRPVVWRAECLPPHRQSRPS